VCGASYLANRKQKPSWPNLLQSVGINNETTRVVRVWSVVVMNYCCCVISYCCCCGDGSCSCCGVAGESGAMANWRARPWADCRMKATSAAASAASSCKIVEASEVRWWCQYCSDSMPKNICFQCYKKNTSELL